MKTRTTKFQIKVLFALLIVFALGISQSLKASGLSGKYTIDPSKAASATNYISFNDADSDLTTGARASGGTANGPGVSGAVTFNVSDGTYLESVDIPAITGASSTNTITFQGHSGDSTKVVLQWTAGGSYSSPNFVLHLNNTSFVKFSEITMQMTMGTASYSYYDHVVIVDNISDSNTLVGCQLIGPYASGVTFYGSLIYSGYNYTTYSYSQDQYNMFSNNYMKGGYYGTYWFGSFTSGGAETGNVFDHNIMDSCYYYGFMIYTQDSIIVSNNKINMPYGNYGMYTIYLGYSYYGNNYHNQIDNNFISIGSTGTPYTNAGMMLYYSDKLNVAYNNVNIYGAASTSYGANIYHYTTTTDVTIYNNNFVNSNASAPLQGYYWTDENYNNLYPSSGSLITYSGSSYSTISAWSGSGSGFGANDVTLDPIYNSNTDLHVNAPGINNVGTPIAGITTDIDGDVRSTTTPDIGADEFTPPAVLPAIKNIASPTSGFCVGTQDVYVNLYNKGVNSITTATIEWSISGVAQTSYSWTGTLASGAMTLVKIGSYSFSSSSTVYPIVSYVSSANGSSFGKTPHNYDSINVRSGLNGSFTIDPAGSGSTNYTSFRAAVSDLNLKGVCGAITYTVADGTYNESVTINTLPGASATNTVTFQSKSKDSSKVILDTAWGGSWSAQGYTLQLNGASWVTFNQITIQNIPSSMYVYANSVELVGGAHNNTFSNERIAVSTGMYSTYGYAITNSGNNNTFFNNEIDGGEYIIYNAGSGGQKGNVYRNNLIDSGSYMGAYLTYQDSFTFVNNKINMSAGYYCLYLYQFSGSGSGTDSSLFANNFINMNTSYGYAVMADYCTMVNFYNNSINAASSASYYYAFYLYNFSTSVFNFVNNIVTNFNGGSCFYVYNSTAVTYSDYNDWYTTGGTLGYWGGTSCSNLAALQSTNSMDVNSVSGDPLFNNAASYDLHLTSLSLPVLHKGVARASVPFDIDGQKRSAHPNIGADETHMYQIDASIAGIDSPTTFCSGTKDIYVSLFNAGATTLTSVNINWSVNGTAMTSYSWTGSLSSLAKTSVKIGSVAFLPAKSKVIKSWTSNPNSATDSNAANDTNIAVKGGGISGTLTIGGVSPDYATFRDAVNALNVLGVCGATTFNVADGTYNESIKIGNIKGTSATATILFQSKSKDSSKVIVDTSWGGSYSSPAYALELNNASYITFKWMSLINTPPSSYVYSDAVYITGKSSYNTIANCVATTNTSSSTYNYGYTIHNDYNTNDPYNTLSNCQINGGNAAIMWEGPYSTSTGELGGVIYHNTIDSAMYYGIMLEYLDSVTVSGNNVNMSSGYYGIYSYGIIGNGTGYDSSYIMNNFVAMNSSYAYALMGYVNNMTNIYNNSFYNNPTSSYYYTVYLYDWYSGHVLNFVNNIAQNDGGGYALYEYNSITNSDYNDFYSASGGNIADWAGTSCATLSDLQTANSMDAHSQSGDAMFASASTGDLHLTTGSSFLMHDGLSLPMVKEDIDQQKRSPKPNIGADETRSYANDASAAAIDSPSLGICGGTKDLYVRLLNAGSSTMTSVTINWSVNGTTMTAYSWTGTLASFTSTSVKVGSVTFKSGTASNIVAWTSKPNGVLDSNAANDTVKASRGGGLSGTYTIGGVSPSYATFRDAANALNNQGLCGPVIFNVRDGYYNEQVNLKAITGSSSTNTVLFQSQSLDSTKVILDTTTSGSYSSHGYVVKLSGTNYVTFKLMTFTNVGSSYTYDDVIYITGKASHNTITNCVVTGNTSGTWNYGYVINDDPNSSGEQYNTIANNQIGGSYYAVYLGAPYGTAEFGNVVTHNMIDSNDYAGIYTYYQDSMTITRNNIFEASAYYGLFMYYSVGVGSGNDTNLVANNFITMSGSNGYGIMAYYNDMLDIYYNSVNVSSSYGYAIYSYHYTSGKIVNLYNNSFVNDNSGPVAYIYNIGISDYNDYYTSGSTFAYWNGSTCASLSDIQTASTYDAGSISGDPYYNSPSTGDLHATSSSTIISNAGHPMSLVTVDIDNEKRSTSKPDIGADEFSNNANDLGVSAILSPSTKDCGNSNTTVSVKVHNYGTAAQSSYSVYVKISGAGTASGNTAVTTTINAGADATVSLSMSPSWNTTSGGKYFIKAYTVLTGDGDASNDTDTATVIISVPTKAKFSVKKANICKGDSFFVTDGTGLASGVGNYKYYLVDYTGAVPVRVDSSTSANPTFTHYTNTGKYRIVQGVATSLTCYDSTSMAVTVNALPVASFTASTACPGDSAHFYNTSTGTIATYAWNFGNGKSASTMNAGTVYAQGTYTAMLTVTDNNGCTSSATKPIGIDSAISRFSYKVDTTINKGTISLKAGDTTMTTYSWDYGDASVGATVATTSHQYTKPGRYAVKLTTTNGGCTTTTIDSITVMWTGINETPAVNYSLNIYPNPFKDQTTIAYSIDNAAQVKVEVMDVLGRTVATLVNHHQVSGSYNVSFNATEFKNANSGIYIVRMSIGDRVITKQITLVK